MKKDILHKKLHRYLHEQSLPAEVSQIENWLSVIEKSDLQLSPRECADTSAAILDAIKEATGYPSSHPAPRQWWQHFLSR